MADIFDPLQFVSLPAAHADSVQFENRAVRNPDPHLRFAHVMHDSVIIELNVKPVKGRSAKQRRLNRTKRIQRDRKVRRYLDRRLRSAWNDLAFTALPASSEVDSWALGWGGEE